MANGWHCPGCRTRVLGADRVAEHIAGCEYVDEAGRAVPTPGLVARSRARSTSTLVSLYDGLAAGLDTDGGTNPWTTMCEDHRGLVTHATRKLAQSWMPLPRVWCEGCQPDCPGEPDPAPVGLTD